MVYRYFLNGRKPVVSRLYSSQESLRAQRVQVGPASSAKTPYMHLYMAIWPLWGST